MPGGKPMLGIWSLAIPKKSTNKKVARDFVMFATSKDQIRKAVADGNPPPREDVLRDVLENDAPENRELRERYPWLATQLESLEKAVPRPRSQSWNTVESALGDCLTTLIVQHGKLEQAAQCVEEALIPVRSSLECRTGSDADR